MTAPGTGLAPTSARIASANSTNATVVKVGPGTITDINVTNDGAGATTIAYFKIYDLARVPTTSDTPKKVLVLAGTGVPVIYSPPGPPQHANGIAYTITGGRADSDATAVAANSIEGELNYY